MLLIDDLLMSPVKGIFWIFKEIHQAAVQEQAGEADAITARLSELYMQLETGQITEAEFEAREKELLDRLDRLQQAAAPPVAKRRQPKKKTVGTRKKASSAAPRSRKLKAGLRTVPM